jgi:hypothetical protein
VARKAAVAGRWYPGTRESLARAVDVHLASVATPAAHADILAIVAPHAGLMYSGPIAAHAYQQLAFRQYDVAFLVGPSHFVDFEGVAIDLSDGFETPLGVAAIDHACARALMASGSLIHVYPAAHAREHSLEMQLPFLQRVCPSTKIVPLVMGRQTASTARELGDALAAAARHQNAVFVASTDLSHFHDAPTAARMDKAVIDCVAAADADALQRVLENDSGHACGGGPAVSVIRAACALGANVATVLKYGDSGDVSGDKSSVVGYLAAAIGHDE